CRHSIRSAKPLYEYSENTKWSKNMDCSSNDESWYTGYWHRTALVTLSREPPVLRNFKNIQTTAFGIGRLFTLSFITTLLELEFNPTSFERIGLVRRLWPLERDNIVWPLPLAPNRDIDQLAESLL